MPKPFSRRFWALLPAIGFAVTGVLPAAELHLQRARLRCGLPGLYRYRDSATSVQKSTISRLAVPATLTTESSYRRFNFGEAPLVVEHIKLERLSAIADSNGKVVISGYISHDGSELKFSRGNAVTVYARGLAGIAVEADDGQNSTILWEQTRSVAWLPRNRRKPVQFIVQSKDASALTHIEIEIACHKKP